MLTFSEKRDTPRRVALPAAALRGLASTVAEAAPFKFTKIVDMNTAIRKRGIAALLGVSALLLVGGTGAQAATITGTPDNDLLFMQGVQATQTITATNPYTGETISVTGTFNVNSESYDGLGGTDTLIMSNLGDVLFIRNSVTGAQDVTDVEVFFAGDGTDHILLADSTYTLGNITIDGGASADVLWANDGNDTVNGRARGDLIDGGPGNDRLNGGTGNSSNSGNDNIHGGLGADYANGEDGNDVLRFSVDGTYTAPFPDSSGPDVTGHNQSLDIFDGDTGFDTIEMTDGDDALFLDDPHHAFHPSGSSLRVIEVERIDAGDGNDVVDLSQQAYGGVILNGGEGNDFLHSSTGDDLINGNAGNDEIRTGAGDDEANGNDGDDTIWTGPGNDLARGNDGDDELWSGDGNDYLIAGAGNDLIFAGNGNDFFEFRLGDGWDFIDGGAGDDFLLFSPEITIDMVAFSLIDDFTVKMLIDGGDMITATNLESASFAFADTIPDLLAYVSATPAAVESPGTLGVLGAGLVGLCLARRRKSRGQRAALVNCGR